MESQHLCALHARLVRKSDASQQDLAKEPAKWRHQCGCLHTSDRLKELLKSFPAPPPPSPTFEQKCITGYFGESFVTRDSEKRKLSENTRITESKLFDQKCITGCFGESFGTRYSEQRKPSENTRITESKLKVRSWELLADLVHLVQLTITATALALYYVIYCYMQLIYYTLRSALYFHNADGPMKITIGVVTLTSVIVGFNFLIRMEKLIGIYLF